MAHIWVWLRAIVDDTGHHVVKRTTAPREQWVETDNLGLLQQLGAIPNQATSTRDWVTAGQG